ncbi:MAG: hypothetical protein IPO47_18830 [Bacteroidetes bacterium]|nr:hypothetical protein [Bacteroidota bacterium]
MNINSVTDLVNFVISSELEQFKQDYDVEPIPKSQDISSLSIEWLCYYCKEQVANDTKNAIISFVDNVLQTKDYKYIGWRRIPALLATAFTLTGKEYYLNDLLNNLACHQSSREFICKALTVICPTLPFDNEFFQSSVLSNLEKRHGFYEISTILLLNSNGDHDMKEKWLIENLESEPLKGNTFLSDWTTGKVYKAEFFQNTLNAIKSHVLFRILKHGYLYNNQYNLFNDNKKVFARTLDVFHDEHPLDTETFEFRKKE